MIRAIYFDFYSVWAPEKFPKYLAMAEQKEPDIAHDIEEAIKKYNFGMADPEFMANTFKFKLDLSNVEPSEFEIREADISQALIDFIRGLHAHFLKIGVFANLGKQEYSLLQTLNLKYQLFEVITGPIKLGAPLLTQEAFAGALQAIGEPPETCLLITGNEQFGGIAAGFGMQTLRFEGFSNMQQALGHLLASNTPG